MKTFKIFILSFICMVACMSCSTKPEVESMDKLIERGLQTAVEQSLIMAKELEPQDSLLPRTYENGKLKTVKYHSWISGFFPGVLWQLYEYNQDEQFRKYAELFTSRVEPAKKMTSTHDLGFMLYCSFGQGYRLTGNKQYVEVIKEGTHSLLTRWNPHLKVMQSWGKNERWQFPVIIDNMMNLEMLCFMTRETSDQMYMDIAKTHANTTIENHFREDYSTYHVVSYDTITGQPHAKHTAQGDAHESSWSRGQSWGLYGYTMMYRETGDPAYLKQAIAIANFLVNHPRLPEDKIPYWDYDAPEIPNAERDASAGAIMASALIELSQLDKSESSSKWLDIAEKQLRSLSSPAYMAGIGEQGGFIIKHGVGHLRAGGEVDVPLSYGDYYYIEALLRYKKLLAQADK